MDGLIEKQLNNRKSAWSKTRENNHNYLNAEIVSECFSTYITHRSKFYEEFNIKEILKEEMLTYPSLFKEVPIKYKAEKILISDAEIDLLQNIITEGKHIDRYKEKIEIVRIFINIMSGYGNRQCSPSCLQDLKVYFREIFISKSSYKKRMAPRIVKEYIKQVSEAEKKGKSIPKFNKQSQYMFVREKISRGYFREKGLSKEYIEKITFEKKFYDFMLKLYLFYDIQDSLEFIYDINYNLLKIYDSQIGT